MTAAEEHATRTARPCDHTALTNLDPTRPPTQAELIAAGNLGEPLSPTREADPATITDPAERRRQQADNLTFGAAIQTWNEHRYDGAYVLFQQHAEGSPASPWNAESKLHLGCYCQYKGLYLEAAGYFDAILAETPKETRMWHKAKLRRSILHLDQGHFDEAERGFAEMYRDDPDPGHKTYASYWIHEISLLRKHETALRDCGQKALARACEILGHQPGAADLRAMPAAGPHGFTARELLNTALLEGLDPQPVHAAQALAQLPLPFIAHYHDRHFVTVEKVSAGLVTLYDTRVGRTHDIPVDSFRAQWSGFAMLFADPPPLAAIGPADDLDTLVGGCCGYPRPPAELGDDPCAKKNCGMPGWSVNLVNMNFRVQDTPMWWDPPFGPPVEISLHFNSLDSLNNMEPFGPKWAFTYASYLLIDPGGAVTVRDGDGRFETFTPTANGFNAPASDRRTLVKNATDDYDLIHQDGTVHHYGIAGLMAGQSHVPLLLSITDRHGNSLTIEHNSNGAITALKHSALGPNEQWTFIYDENLPVSRVKRINDPFGRACYFDYDGQHRLQWQADMGQAVLDDEPRQYGYTYTIKPTEGQYWDPVLEQYPVADELLIESIITPNGTTAVVTEPSDGEFVEDEYGVPNVAYPPYGGSMWSNYRIRVTDPGNHLQEFYFSGSEQSVFTRDGAQIAAAVTPNPATPWLWTGPKTVCQLELIAGRGRITGATSQSPDQGSVDLGSTADYDPAVDRPRQRTGPDGQTTWYAYNPRGNPTKIKLPKSDGADNTDYELRLEYTANGTDLVNVKRNLGGTEKTLLQITYHANRDPNVITDVLGRTLTYTWYPDGRPDTVTWSPTSDVVTFQCDANRRPSGILVNGQSVLATGYDIEGRLASVLDAAGYLVNYQYDALNRLEREDHPDGSFIKRIWTCCFVSEILAGMRTGGTDRILERTLIQHDPRGLSTRVTDTAGRVTRYAYDGAGRLASLTDPRDQTTTWHYDHHGRLSRKVYPNQSEEAFDWSNAVQLLSTTNRRGDTLWFGYDAHGPLSFLSGPDFTTEYFFDSWDRLDALDHSTQPGPSEVHDFSHDLLGRVTSIDGPWPDDTISWSYNDTLRKVTRTTPGSIVTETIADAFGRVVNVQDPLGLCTFAYTDQSPKPDGITHTQGNANGTPYSGFDTIFTWHGDDQRRALESITHKRPGGDIVAKHSYGYDDLGRITSWKREAQLANPSGPTREYEWSIHHDLASQLSSVIERGLGGSLQAAWHYGYDPAGNITSAQAHTDASSPASISRRSHNNLNQIATLGGGGATLVRGALDEPGIVSVGRPGGPSKTARMLDGNRFEAEVVLEPDASGSDVLVVQAADSSGNVTTESFEVEVDEPDEVSFTYDDDGNLLDDDGTSPAKYEWDSLSRLTKVKWAAGKTTEFRYNGLGQRVERIETDGSTVTHHYYLFDGIALVDRRTGSSASADRRYFGEGEQRYGGSQWDTHHYCRDHLGSVREVLKADGTLMARYDYSPYGERITRHEATGYSACDHGFTGHITVPSLESGQNELMLAHFRAYDPHLGRWLSADPIGEEGGTNLCGYVRNHPVIAADLLGLSPLACPAVAEAWTGRPGKTEVTVGQAIGFMTGAVAANGVVAVGGYYAVAAVPEAAFFLLRNPAQTAAAVASLDETGVVGAGLAVTIAKGMQAHGGMLRNGALVQGNQLFLGLGGHFDGAARAGAQGVNATTCKGISTFEKGNKLFWANDSPSLGKAITPDEAKAIQAGLEEAFSGKEVLRVTNIWEAVNGG